MDTTTTDRAEVTELFARLAVLLNQGRHEEVHRVYADDVEVRSPKGGVLRGIDEVAAFLEGVRAAGERTHHVHGDVPVDGPADGTAGRRGPRPGRWCSFHRPDGRLHRSAGLRVRCTAADTPAGRRFTRVDIALMWTWQAAPADRP
ncbi:nuclear transport factor 2 family protein [Nocardiopsis halophila]|uniref:nuclear transport factor 2 family protein n=1 Tax=Nocardiopsis halophila TaxID=141692 RepID=UPI00035C7723|nr:nuclear transport factor 2 family protein [Nocardiopsis halophila]